MLDILAKWNRWGGAELKGGIRRDVVDELSPLLNSKDIIVLIGPRRAGKTTVLFQMMDILEESGVKPEALLHVNFEEPAFAPKLSIDLLEEIYNNYRVQVFPEGKAYLFLDEIQNIDQWERWVRARNDTENIKIFITGSSSRLMSRELGTLLTGRHLSFKVLPLSFKEFLRFEKIDIPNQKLPITAKPKIHHALNKYLKWGGFPEVVLAEDDYRKELLLRQYFDDILFKDVAMRHRVRDIVTLRNLAVHLLTQTGSLISSQRIAKLFGVSLDLAKAYCNYLQEAFLINFVPFYSQKVAERNRNPQKIYVLDLGLRQVASFAHSPDTGHLIETAVYNTLTRQNNDGIFYWKQQNEVDFLVRKGSSIKTLIQVVSDNAEAELPPREMNALVAAAEKFPKAEKVIVTTHKGNKSKIKLANEIQFLPLWNFLLVY